ncbi:hypothetical protein LEP1GSC047_3117 [Leptospira inadai serovar Lyme str. 10]|uniref:Uncharacterized protein n=1 Tax=Leptospira inadai serovar Lyme str. 10 TaxID=1049790 RepID=V6HIF0_9LEPT|nr:hypothetical protein LEP1GSC047_3117 [Leptospira inadai serovar Lyme str. 10]
MYINADDIEASLRKNHKIELLQYRIIASTKEIQNYFKKSQFSPIKSNKPDLWKSFQCSDNFLEINPSQPIDSYVAADLAEFFRSKMMENKISYSFETVMSYHRKIDLIELAKSKGYTIYLYISARKIRKLILIGSRTEWNKMGMVFLNLKFEIDTRPV